MAAVLSEDFQGDAVRVVLFAPVEGLEAEWLQVLAPDIIRLRVFERGVGETLACGSGACAAVAVLARQGKVGRKVDVQLPGGTLTIEWQGEGAPVRMAGPAAFVFEGEWRQ
jgi:diaminopimelate epimerase